jgi:acyl-coenzyme A synthetase/AMP-(fatty) acid ligase
MGRSVLLSVHDQLAAALAIIEMDGVARRMILCPPDLAAEHVPSVIAKAEVDAIVTDAPVEQSNTAPLLQVTASPVIVPSVPVESVDQPTEWVLLTSGTTGAPKLLAHTLASLTAPINRTQHQENTVVWGTYYDIRRYGGLQIFLRALLGRGSLILSSAEETPAEHLLRLASHGVTHLTGTPSHWRRALMSPAANAIAPRYVRLSGEIADQAILNSLRSFYPQAAVGHAFASTEAGVGFEVNDGLEGFPPTVIGSSGNVEIKVEDDSLRFRSTRTAGRYIGEENAILMDGDGFVDTGDIVQRRGDRYYFLGRRSGLINVGGLKVYPEEIEALINLHPSVRMSCVRARRNPITGALVVADVLLKDEPAGGKTKELKEEIIKLCRDNLPRHKVPAALNFVTELGVATTGKISRKNA